MDKIQELNNRIELEKELKDKQDEINKLKEKIAKLKEERDYGQWIPNNDNGYYYVDESGEIYGALWNGDSLDKGILSIGNVFKTEEEAEFQAERLRVINELRQYSSDFVCNEDNFAIEYNFKHNCLVYDVWGLLKSPVLYFPSREIAQHAVAMVGEERVKKYYLGIK